MGCTNSDIVHKQVDPQLEKIHNVNKILDDKKEAKSKHKMPFIPKLRIHIE